MLQGAGKVKVPTLLLIGGLVIKIFANQLLVPLWDVTGAAIAGNIGFAAITFGLLLYFKKVWPIQLAPARFYGWVYGGNCPYDSGCLTVDDHCGRVFIRQVTGADRGDTYRANIRFGGSGCFPFRHYEITYNGREGMVSTAIR